MEMHLFIACFLQFLLTMVVLTLMVLRRVGDVKAGITDPKFYKTFDYETEVPKQTRQLSRNFVNQFETPVLFYVIVVLILAMELAHLHLVVLAYGYVVSRVLHTIVHLTSNRIPHRMATFMVTTLFLLALWVRTLIAVVA